MEVVLDSNLFHSRLNRFNERWNTGFNEKKSGWYGVDATLFLSGRQDDSIQTPKTNKFHLYLFGYVFPETLIILLRSGLIYIITGPKKLSLLKKYINNDNIVLLEKSNPDKNLAHMDVIFKGIAEYRKGLRDMSILTLGHLTGKHEVALGMFAEQIQDHLTRLTVPEAFKYVSLDEEIALVLSICDEHSLEYVAKASRLAVSLVQEILITRMEDILDNEITQSHIDIVNLVENALDDPKVQQRWKTKYGLESDDLDLVCANIQSGRACDLNPFATPSSEPLYMGSGTILMSLGAKYQDYCATVSRTLLFNATKNQRTTYQFTVDTLEYGIKLLKPGVVLSSIYSDILGYIRKHIPSLVNYATRNFGHITGHEFWDPSLTINDTCSVELVEGMVVALSIGFSNVKEVTTGVPYSVWLTDTIAVRAAGELPKVFTADLHSRLKMVNYELSDEVHGDKIQPSTTSQECLKEQDKIGTKPREGSSSTLQKQTKDGIPDASKGKSDKPSPSPPKESVILRTRLRNRGQSSNLEEVERLLHRQRMLRKNKLSELQERFKEGSSVDLSSHQAPVKKLSSVTAYTSASAFPVDLKPNRIYLDTANESLLVPIPILGHIPFHVSMIRNVICQPEDKTFYRIRIQFQVPGNPGFSYKAEANPFPESIGPNGLYIKELIFRSSHPGLPQLCKGFKDLQKHMKQEQSSNTTQALAVPQPLMMAKRDGKRLFLKNVVMRTGTNSRRTPAILEAFGNGLRYSGPRVETIEINYSHIKHAFFQPCEHEFAVVHFHLKNPIIVKKKKTLDIQFLSEVGTQMEDLDQRRRCSTYDPDEILEEQRERELKRKINSEFKHFVQNVEEIAKQHKHKLEFEIPFRELGFYGVPKNSNQLMLPTARCIVQLLEWPVFILTLEEVEIVSFERVYHGLRQFDMVFVFKSYQRPVRQITTIPVGSLDMIKRWLNEVDIVWYESKGNLNWGEILKTICEDVVGFVEDGGFGIFLDDEMSSSRKRSKKGSEGEEDDEDTEDDEDDDDTSVTISDSDDEDATEDDGSLDSSEEGTDEDEDSLSLASENESSVANNSSSDSEEEGLTWEELERQAIRDDRKRARGLVESNEGAQHYSNDTFKKKKKA